MDLEKLSEAELEQLKIDLAEKKEAIRQQMREVDAAWSKKIQMRNIRAKLTEGELAAIGVQPARVEVEPISVSIAAK